MEKTRSKGVTIFGWLSFMFALLNLALYAYMLLLMGIKWQIGVFGKFVKGNPQALGLIWTNYSPLVFGVLLIYVGWYLLKGINRGFIKTIAITYLIINTIGLFTNITAIIFTFPNMVFFILLLVFLTRPKVKEQLK